MDREDVERFIQLVAGITPPAGLVEAVYHQTEGNPLFVTEVVRLLVQEGGLAPERTPPSRTSVCSLNPARWHQGT